KLMYSTRANGCCRRSPGLFRCNFSYSALSYKRGVWRRAYAEENLEPDKFPVQVEEIADGNENKILIDGNTASAMGLMDSGCTFAAWYPITPSSSLVESFEKFARKYKKDEQGKATYAVVQGEDELSSICMAIGAGWAGARAMTATSGPGISLMAEAAGLAYFAEVPAVIWDVQRVGPSTGLPTRTMQGDILSAYTLSHGDTKHVVLLPQDPKECFEFGRIAFDMAEELQTLVLVLTDLDIGMNQHISERLEVNPEPLKRGKVLDADDLERLGEFARYKDVDGDGIGHRTLPGTEHELAAYFTRGTGHDEKALYSEDNDVFKANMDRLLKKFETAKTMGPQPEVVQKEKAEAGLIFYGSTAEAMKEGLHLLEQDAKLSLSHLRVRALPLSEQVRKFIESNPVTIVVEQNRDAQLFKILCMEYPELAGRLKKVHQYDGLPLEGRFVFEQVRLALN
ncbi:MAG: 2-oxoacid:acceptor oxidoreductase subunit alpha, partial [Pseudomonadota bacterium]